MPDTAKPDRRWRIHVGGALILQTRHEDSFLWACQRISAGKSWHVARTTMIECDPETGHMEELIDYYLVERQPEEVTYDPGPTQSTPE